jgi:hypothetical protein
MGHKSGGAREREYTNLVPWCMSVVVGLISVEVLGGFETSSAIIENISCMDSSNKNDIGPRELVCELSFIEVLIASPPRVHRKWFRVNSQITFRDGNWHD